jgi:hypothetical protein
MFTKTVKPVISKNITGASCAQSKYEDPRVIGTIIEYRFFGLLLYRKSLVTPEAYDLKEYEFYTTV